MGGSNFSDNSIGGGGTVNHYLTNDAGSWILVRCTAANIPSAAAGYAVGCLLQATDTGNAYVNTGTITSSTFTLLDSSSASLVLPTAATDATTTTTTSLALTQDTVTTGAGLTQSLNGLTTGKGHSITHTTSVIASGGTLLNLSSTGVDTATTSGALLTLTSTASTAGTQVLATLSGLTTGIGVSLVTAALTTGSALSIAANALTSGNAITLSSSSTDATARGVIQVTNSGSGSTGTALIRGTQVVQSTNFRRILTESGSGVTLWFSNGTTANGNLSGTAGDICFNGGSGKPEYCTGTTSWTALV